jgi:hypothetical protein
LLLLNPVFFISPLFTQTCTIKNTSLANKTTLSYLGMAGGVMCRFCQKKFWLMGWSDSCCERSVGNFFFRGRTMMMRLHYNGSGKRYLHISGGETSLSGLLFVKTGTGDR